MRPNGCKVIGGACLNGICEDRGSGLECVCKKGFIPRSSDGVCVGEFKSIILRR